MKLLVLWLVIFVLVVGGIVNPLVYADDDDDEDRTSFAQSQEATPTPTPSARPTPTTAPTSRPTPTPEERITPTPRSNPTQTKTPTPTPKVEEGRDEEKEKEDHDSNTNFFSTILGPPQENPPNPPSTDPLKDSTPTKRIITNFIEHPLSKLLRVTPQELYENRGLSPMKTIFLLSLAFSMAFAGGVMIASDIFFSRPVPHKLIYSS